MGLRESIRMLRTKAKEKYHLSKLGMRARLGDYEAKKKLLAIEEFKKEGFRELNNPYWLTDYYSAEDIREIFENHQKRLNELKDLVEGVKKEADSGKLSLTRRQVSMLDALLHEAQRSPEHLNRITELLRLAHENRLDIARYRRIAPEKRSDWFKYLWRFFPIKPGTRGEFWRWYDIARIYGLPWRQAGTYAGFYKIYDELHDKLRKKEEDKFRKEKEDLPRLFAMNVKVFRSIRGPRDWKHPALRDVISDPRSLGEFNELLSILGARASNYDHTRDVAFHAIRESLGEDDAELAGKLAEHLERHLKEKVGGDWLAKLAGRSHAERVIWTENAKKLAADLAKTVLKPIDEEIKETQKKMEELAYQRPTTEIGALKLQKEYSELEAKVEKLKKKKEEAVEEIAKSIVEKLTKQATVEEAAPMPRASKFVRREREKRKLAEKIIREFAQEYGEEAAMRALALMTKRAGRRRAEAGNLAEFFKRIDRRAAGAYKGRQAFKEAGAFFGRWDSTMDLRKALLRSREEQIRRVAELMWRYGFVVNPSTGKTSGETEMEMLRKMGALKKHNASDILLQRFLRLAKNVPARTPGAQGVPSTMVRKQAAMNEILREIDKIRKIEKALKEIERRNFE